MSNISERPFVVLDVETTGLNPDRHDIIEVVAFRCDPSRSTIDGRRYLFQPTLVTPAEPAALRLNGWTPERWEDHPARISQLGLIRFDNLLEHLRGCYIVAHNAAFDLAFLRGHLRAIVSSRGPRDPDRELSRLERPTIWGIVDTISIFWALLGSEVSSLSLSGIRAELPDHIAPGLSRACGPSHTAEGDAQYLLGLLTWHGATPALSGLSTEIRGLGWHRQRQGWRFKPPLARVVNTKVRDGF